MGLAASQVTFLKLTDQNSRIDWKLHQCSLTKNQLTRDMRQVTQDYQNALAAKKLKWSNNSGVNCNDLSYNTLMSPNLSNANSPVLVTNDDGKVVLNKKYQKYAQMIDANGRKWSGDVRNQVLEELTGIPANTIDLANKAEEAANDAADVRNSALNDMDVQKSKEPAEYLTIDKLAKRLGSYNGVDLSSLYAKGSAGNYSFSSKADIVNLANAIKNNMSKYFIDDELLGITDKTKFEKACDNAADTYTALIDATNSSADQNRESCGLKGSTGDWDLDISQFFAAIMATYEGSYKTNSNTNEKAYTMRDTSSASWKNWYNDYKNKTDAYNASETAYSKAVDTSSQILDAAQETKIEFYDLLFQAVADNGWTYDNRIEESEYLNQQLQNNNYYVTTVTKNSCYNPDLGKSNCNTEFFYDTNIATNFKNIFLVNDSDAANQALVEYENKKNLINDKEQKVDERMRNLQTQQAAIKKMMETVQAFSKDNTERTYKMWA